MIEVTVNNIVNSIPFIQKLTTVKLPARLAYRVVCLANEIQDEYQRIDNIRKELADKYFEKDTEGNFVTDETGTSYKVRADAVEDYIKESEDFINEKVTLKSDKLPVEILDKMEDVSASEMVLCTVFFE